MPSTQGCPALPQIIVPRKIVVGGLRLEIFASGKIPKHLRKAVVQNRRASPTTNSISPVMRFVSNCSTRLLLTQYVLARSCAFLCNRHTTAIPQLCVDKSFKPDEQCHSRRTKGRRVRCNISCHCFIDLRCSNFATLTWNTQPSLDESAASVIAGYT